MFWNAGIHSLSVQDRYRWNYRLVVIVSGRLNRPSDQIPMHNQGRGKRPGWAATGALGFHHDSTDCGPSLTNCMFSPASGSLTGTLVYDFYRYYHSFLYAGGKSAKSRPIASHCWQSLLHCTMIEIPVQSQCRVSVIISGLPHPSQFGALATWGPSPVWKTPPPLSRSSSAMNRLLRTHLLAQRWTDGER